MAENGNKKKNADSAVVKKAKMKNRLQTLLYLFIIFATIAALILFAVFVLDPVFIYRSAGKLADEGNYSQAIERYESLDGFLNSEKKIAKIQERILEDSIGQGNYEAAVQAAEKSGELEKYIEEQPEIFFEYAKKNKQSDPAVAKTYLAYIPDYPGAKELYDEVCLRNAWDLTEMGRYGDVLKNFDEASSLAWFSEVPAETAYEYALSLSQYSYLRTAQVLDIIREVSPAAKEKADALDGYLRFCGEKTCISDSADNEAVNAVNVFDFFAVDDKEYLIVADGNVDAVYDTTNSTFEKDTDGSYFAVNYDAQSNATYQYRFRLLENGSVQENVIVTLSDGTVQNQSRLWS